MGEEPSSRAYIIAKQVVDANPGATVRGSDGSGPAVFDDPRLHAQLEVIVGRSLSQFAMSVGGVRLALWGDEAGSISREILIEHQSLAIRQPGHESAVERAWNEDLVATSLLSALGRIVTGIDVAGGFLVIDFDSGLSIRVEPDPRYESWQISSDDGLLIVCTPGGGLTVWYPDLGT